MEIIYYLLSFNTVMNILHGTNILDFCLAHIASCRDNIGRMIVLLKITHGNAYNS